MSFSHCIASCALSLVLLGTATGADEEFFAAVGKGDLSEVRRCLEANPELVKSRDESSKYRDTALHVAAAKGHYEIVELLLARGAEVDAGDSDDSTPLDVAAQRGKAEVLKLLVHMGADVNHVDRNGMTPLHFCSSRGGAEIISFLLERGAKVDAASKDGLTPLHYAAFGGRADFCKLLLAAGADLEARSSEGFTPVLAAAWSGKVEAVSCLLEKGARADARSQHGQSLASLAVTRSRDAGMLRMLLERGVDPDEKNPGGVPLLFDAAYSGSREVAELLLQRGADPNARTPWGGTPLFAALYADRSELVELLLSKGAKTDLCNEVGDSPLLIAISKGKDEITRQLLEHGAPLDRPDEHWGRTPLHLAAIKGNAGIAGLLLERGAKLDARERSGATAIELAARYGHPDVVALLSKKGADAPSVKSPSAKSILEKELPAGEAVAWYLGHCGWAIRTRSHLLIFDYWNQGEDPARPSLANGHVDPGELAGQKVAVFVTHGHRDHFDPAILEWKAKHEDVSYIFGFKPEEHQEYRERGYHGPSYEYAAPRSSLELDGMKIHTIRSNDEGVGFLVEVDGLAIYHAGDHAGWRDGERQGFLDEVDHLAQQVERLDLAFVNITGCHAHSPERLAEGTVYTVRKLQPAATVPTHALDREHEYLKCEKIVRENALPTEVLCPRNRGDHFSYRRASPPR